MEYLFKLRDGNSYRTPLVFLKGLLTEITTPPLCILLHNETNHNHSLSGPRMKWSGNCKRVRRVGLQT